MSRRAKLLILALFFLLLAIPAVYVVLSWSPQAPIRVRLLTAEEMREVLAPVPRYVHTLDSKTTTVLVENTSSVPIRLYGLSEGDLFPRCEGMGYPSPGPSPVPTKEYVTVIGSMPAMNIPPHSSLHFQIVHTSASLPYPPEKVGGIYASRTKEGFLRALDWCTVHCPDSLHFLLPELLPDWSILPVQAPPPHATSPSPAP